MSNNFILNYNNFVIKKLVVIVFPVAISILIVRKWNKKKQSGRRYPPSLPSLPLVGSLPFLRNFDNIAAFLLKKSKDMGPIFAFWAGNKYVLTLNSREVIHEAFVKNSRMFSNRADVFIEKTINPSKKGIAFMDTTAEWKQIHQSSLSIFKEFGFGVKNLMEDKILKEVEAMFEFVRSKQGKSFQPNELTVMVSSNIIQNMLFGRRRDYNLGISEFVIQIEKYLHYLDLAYDVAPFVKYIPHYSKKISGMKECMSKAFAIIDKKTEKSLADKENNCFVRRYIEIEGPDYDREQFNFLVRDLVVGGTDTISNTTQWLLGALVNNRHIQKRLQDEIDSVIPRDRFPQLKDQINLPYVEATILELYRWRTLIPMTGFHFVPQDTQLNGYYVSAGTLVVPNLFAAHHNPDVWGDPDVFRPERFLGNDNKIIGRERVIPFSLGRRSCFGEILARAEVFLITASLMQRFTVLPPEGQDKVDVNISLPISIGTIPEPFSIRLIERH